MPAAATMHARRGAVLDLGGRLPLFDLHFWLPAVKDDSWSWALGYAQLPSPTRAPSELTAAIGAGPMMGATLVGVRGPFLGPCV